MNINLGPQWEAFIDENLKSGRYLSASELVREGLRLLQEKEEVRQARLGELRKEVDKGLDALDHGAFIELNQDGMKRHLENVKAKGRARRAGQP
jgi:antitoxin ParD1/3/4